MVDLGCTPNMQLSRKDIDSIIPSKKIIVNFPRSEFFVLVYSFTYSLSP